tara:strand:+ start:2850 stop:3947 length:1098 start_codon:yes stop_codon:yes gene_type:complete
MTLASEGSLISLNYVLSNKRIFTGKGQMLPLTEPMAAKILDRIHGCRVLVVGDMVVDEHRLGQATRLSREAPVSVIEQNEHLFMPGGGANLAYNLHSLGATVAVAGIVGDDPSSCRLHEMMTASNIQTAGLIKDPSRATPVKLRVWASGDRQDEHQQVARIDIVDRTPIKEDYQQELLKYLADAVPTFDCIMISDYENGVVDDHILTQLIPLAAANGALIAADSHGLLSRFSGIDAITPNQPEAEDELGDSLSSDTDVLNRGLVLQRKLQCKHLLITLGARGMALVSDNYAPVLIPARTANSVADTTGAGDTVAATFVLALLTDAKPLHAAQLANIAGSIVVTKLGAATVSRDEILSLLKNGSAT